VSGRPATTLPVIAHRGYLVVDANGWMWGDKYQARRAGKDEFLACIHCGRDTSKQGNSLGVIVTDGGGTIILPADEDTYPHDGGHMGWFPVGSECIKAVPVEYRVENPYDNKARGV
jgi:hypothetical protein